MPTRLSDMIEESKPKSSGKPLAYQRMEIGFKAVIVRCLNKSQEVVSAASGFICEEDDKLWLYTCWHVVTGLDRNNLQIPNSLPDREFLEIGMQDAQIRQEGVTAIGGLQSFTIPLYEVKNGSKVPLWHQDKRHVSNPDLNGVGIFVPFWHDAVRLELPSDVRTTPMQVTKSAVAGIALSVGEKVYIVGYPYGYSVGGADQPTPVVLTRFVASSKVGDRHQEFLLDGYGAKCMSGGPVFVERDSELQLLGLYTGLIYPDAQLQRNELTTALGTCSNLSLHLAGHLQFVLSPDECKETDNQD